jgi:hypothetical protein
MFVFDLCRILIDLGNIQIRNRFVFLAQLAPAAEVLAVFLEWN